MRAAYDPVHDALLDERIVFLDGELDDEAGNRIIGQLVLLAARDARRDITLHLNSTSGSVTAAMAVHDVMRMVGPDVATWAIGLAGSAAQVLLSAGAPGKRHALPHARIQLRRPAAGAGAREVSGELRREVVELTARYADRSVEEITADADRDRWFTAAEAREYGLVDHVVGS